MCLLLGRVCEGHVQRLTPTDCVSIGGVCVCEGYVQGLTQTDCVFIGSVCVRDMYID